MVAIFVTYQIVFMLYDDLQYNFPSSSKLLGYLCSQDLTYVLYFFQVNLVLCLLNQFAHLLMIIADGLLKQFTQQSTA